MDIQKMRQIASQFGLKNETVNQAIKMAESANVIKNGKFEGSAESFKSIVNQHGGVRTLNKGLEKLNNPIIKGALKLIGIDVDKAKTAINKAMGSNSNSNDTDLVARLKKLK